MHVQVSGPDRRRRTDRRRAHAHSAQPWDVLDDEATIHAARILARRHGPRDGPPVRGCRPPPGTYSPIPLRRRICEYKRATPGIYSPGAANCVRGGGKDESAQAEDVVGNARIPDRSSSPRWTASSCSHRCDGRRRGTPSVAPRHTRGIAARRGYCAGKPAPVAPWQAAHAGRPSPDRRRARSCGQLHGSGLLAAPGFVTCPEKYAATSRTSSPKDRLPFHHHGVVALRLFSAGGLEVAQLLLDVLGIWPASLGLAAVGLLPSRRDTPRRLCWRCSAPSRRRSWRRAPRRQAERRTPLNPPAPMLAYAVSPCGMSVQRLIF